MIDWFKDGERLATVSVEDRAFQYGDGLFETVAIRDGEPRLWQYHLERLARGCERLGIITPIAKELRQSLQLALRLGSATPECCVAKIIVSGGIGKRGYGREQAVAPSTWFGVFAAAPLPLASYQDGVDTKMCETRLATGSTTAGLKTLNRLEQVLAKSELINQKLFEGLTMDASGIVICGTMSNVFFVSNKQITTPALNQCGVEGVMRRHVIATLASHNISVSDAAYDADDLASVDEVFITNSQFGVLPVKSCGQLAWPVGETTHTVMTLVADRGVPECRI